MSEQFQDKLAAVCFSLIGVGLATLITVGALSLAVLAVKFTYETVTHWEQCK
ncbi:hypothetical protein J2W39_000879 [Variovorax paradoxus]|uniref:Uncharacterized protein n=1 Tax=Variovorax paradoxus TaxID=34073 RepID=A0AAW8EC02_VARPD|nr:hypothetical protein [Variovorax paradoxus]MDP9969651.1 hypothetical protein [Variovorax paradoxus]